MTPTNNTDDAHDQLNMGPLPIGQTPELDTNNSTTFHNQKALPVYGRGIEEKKLNPKILIGAFVILVLLAVGGVLAMQSSGLLSQNQDTRSRAACIQCGGGTCPDGWSYPGDSCAPQQNCGQRATEACSGHQGAPQQQQQATQAPANNTQNTTTSCNCGGIPCGQTRCRNNGDFMDVCQNGNWTAAATNTCPRPAPVVTTAATQAPANTSTNTTSTNTNNDCTGKNCGAGTCFTGANANDGGWGCNCTNGTTLGPSTNPGVCPSIAVGGTSTTCTNGQVRCRSGQYNDICQNGTWTAGGNACTPLTGGGTPAAGCVGGVSCPISYCNDGQDVPADGCYKGGSCLSRTSAACVGHNGSQGGAGGVAITPATTTSTATTGTYTAGSKSGTGTMGDACTTTADCGKSGTVQMGCNYCGAAIGYKCTMGGSTNAVEVGCSQPGLNTITYPTACNGLGGFQIRCHNDGTYVGDICYYDTTKKTWSITTVIADACGATCENGGIQQSSNANRCSGPAGPNSIVTASGFIGCGNAVTGGNGDACSNCYKVSGKVTCSREGTSCGAKVECQTRTTAAAPITTTNPTVTQSQSSVQGMPLITDRAGQCVMVKLWIKDTNGSWVNIPFNQAAGKIKTGDTVRLSTSGGGRVFTQGRFRIKINDGQFGAWQTTSTKDNGEYYINYVIPSLSLFVVESQVF